MLGEYLDLDRTDNLGMEKSLQIWINLDVRKPLKKQISLKLHGGETCSCPVKYEKLPLICFYCDRLGHGTNDCKDVFGDQSPAKLFGPWLKASPWKPISLEEVHDENGSMQKCGRRLFVTKKLDLAENRGECDTDNIIDVTSILDKVVLGDKKEEGPVDVSPKQSEEQVSSQPRSKTDWGRG